MYFRTDRVRVREERMYLLEMSDDIGRKLSFPIRDTSTVVTIGRRRENDLILTDLSVSRNHAQLSFNKGQLVIEDLNSANGVYVNNKKIDDPCPLKVGDEIIIGENRLFLRETKDQDPRSRTAIDV